ncbi:hypothetical protein PRIPAC_76976 [Pristionchus pacificus]|uniref:Uncharacterized protein n=1 Tax=Pristionchus pacificus TaxID=54126 RepID=A0A2A6CJK2_PRIPA|nr:hypothetical protein PRIPAC_76976 [Pristionchus pacificus]|eukprot:PDM78382.1 hypothetical protein PRIPAC_30961 [Pristionchus pacificus]
MISHSPGVLLFLLVYPCLTSAVRTACTLIPIYEAVRVRPPQELSIEEEYRFETSKAQLTTSSKTSALLAALTCRDLYSSSLA